MRINRALIRCALYLKKIKRNINHIFISISPYCTYTQNSAFQCFIFFFTWTLHTTPWHLYPPHTHTWWWGKDQKRKCFLITISMWSHYGSCHLTGRSTAKWKWPVEKKKKKSLWKIYTPYPLNLLQVVFQCSVLCAMTKETKIWDLKNQKIFFYLFVYFLRLWFVQQKKKDRKSTSPLTTTCVQVCVGVRFVHQKGRMKNNRNTRQRIEGKKHLFLFDRKCISLFPNFFFLFPRTGRGKNQIP